MNWHQLAIQIIQLQNSDLDLMEAKNQDYTDKDALENLREFGLFGIVVRLGDKFARLKNLVGHYGHEKQPHVKDESIDDTLRDIGNYCYLARAMMQERKEKA